MILWALQTAQRAPINDLRRISTYFRPVSCHACETRANILCVNGPRRLHRSPPFSPHLIAHLSPLLNPTLTWLRLNDSPRRSSGCKHFAETQNDRLSRWLKRNQVSVRLSVRQSVGVSVPYSASISVFILLIKLLTVPFGWFMFLTSSQPWKL